MRQPMVGSIEPITSTASGDVMRQPVVGNIVPITPPASGDTMSTDLQNVVSSQTNSIVSGSPNTHAPNSVIFTQMGTPTIWRKTENELPENLADALFEITCKAEENQTDSKNIINVTRDNLLDGSFRAVTRATFHPADKLSVRFAGEFRIDGGLARDFLTCAMVEIEQKLFYGPETARYLKLNTTGKLPDI